MLTSITVVVAVGCAMWAALVLVSVFMKPAKPEKTEQTVETESAQGE